MNCLAVDTTNSRLVVVLIKDGETFFRQIEVGKSGHSKLLMPTVDEVLKEGGVKVGELNAVAAVVGPGSFTGIRIGVSAMTALAFATGARRISVTSFDLIAYNRQNVHAIVDAGRGNYYCAECENGKVLSTTFTEAGNAPEGGECEPVCESYLALAGVVRDKIAAGNGYCEVLIPFYMRKSQAEREKDEG